MCVSSLIKSECLQTLFKMNIVIVCTCMELSLFKNCFLRNITEVGRALTVQAIVWEQLLTL